MAERVKLESPWGESAPDYTEVRIREGVQDFDLELGFTETYRRHRQQHVAIREATCLRALFPAVFEDIRRGDLFAGRAAYHQVGFGLEQASGGPGYYCHEGPLRREIESSNVDGVTRDRLEDLIVFWREEATIGGKLASMLPDDVRQGTSNDIASMGGRLSGALLDFAKLVRIGLPGLRAEVQEGHARVLRDGGDAELYEGMGLALDLFVDVCRHYAAQARQMAAETDDEGWETELLEMADILLKITASRPETLREGIQLLWLYALISGVVNYGRLDVALGDLLVRDLETGVLTEARALILLQSLWQLIADRGIFFNGRVIVGGRGRPNETSANRFAMLAMEATRTVVETEPQLTLRTYDGQDSALMQKALDVLGEGRTYPMLYNDDVNVPAVQHAFGVSEADAVHYLPYGCGEYALDHISFGSPNCALNLLKALEAALHNGRDPLTGEALGLQTGELGSFETFEDLFAVYKAQVEHHVAYLAKRHALEYRAERESAAFLYVSMLYDDCLAKGRSIVDGGAHYLGGIVESFGLVNVADSLTAIKQLVYEEKRLTRERLLAALTADFVGYEVEHQWMLSVPKYGNDEDAVDGIAQEVSLHACQVTREQAAKVGLDYFLLVNINNFANVALGNVTAASADGRKAGAPLANGNTPTAGMDRKGVTAFLNSIVKLDPSVHAGYVHNMKFSKQMFGPDRPKLEALLQTYFAMGGTQAMITVVSRDDLENAMRAPDRYRNLIVRVGGFSARFVELTQQVQLDLLKRTLY